MRAARATRAACAVASIAIVASCSTVHGVDPSKRSLGTTTTAPGSTSPHGNDKTIINQVVLRLTDLSGDWTVGATARDDQTYDPQMARCLGVPDADTHKTSYAGSPRFQQGVVEISSQASIFDSAQVVQNDIRGAQSPKLVECQSNELEQAVPGISRVQIRTSALPATARGLSGFRVSGSAQIVESGTSTPVYLDEVGLARGRIEVSLSIVSVRLPEPAGLVDQATAVLAGRLAAAAG